MGTVAGQAGPAAGSPASIRPAPASRAVSDAKACLIGWLRARGLRTVPALSDVSASAGRPVQPRHGGRRGYAVAGAGRAMWARAMAEPLTVLFEDNHCLAVAKPAPLLTQGVPPGVPTLEALVKDYLKEKYHKAGRVYLGIPHRLDRPVSGVVLFARNSKAAARLAEQFERRQVIKTYWGAVEGDLTAPEGVWTDWVKKIKEESRSEAVPEGTDGARQAILRYGRLQSCDGGC